MKTPLSRFPWRHRRSRCLGGFTLLEIIVAVSIFSVIVGVLATAFVQASRTWSQADAIMQTSQSARTAVDMLNRDLQCMLVDSNHAATFGNSALTFNAAVTTPSGACDIATVSYYLALPSNLLTPASSTLTSLCRLLQYATAPGSTNITSVATEIAPNVCSLTGGGGLTLSYWLANGAPMNLPTTTTVSVPERVYLQMRVLDSASAKAGAMLTPSGTYVTSFFVLPGLR
jgi:prepilin-type N-terminal cleavage/methylation domain-containing protein